MSSGACAGHMCWPLAYQGKREGRLQRRPLRVLLSVWPARGVSLGPRCRDVLERLTTAGGGGSPWTPPHLRPPPPPPLPLFEQNHIEERLLDQAQARASFPPPFMWSFT